MYMESIISFLLKIYPRFDRSKNSNALSFLLSIICLSFAITCFVSMFIIVSSKINSLDLNLRPSAKILAFNSLLSNGFYK